MAAERSERDRDAADTAIVHVAEELASAGVSIAADFLRPAEVHALADDCRALRLADAFRLAHVGRGETRELRPEIRGDSVCWLREPGATAAQHRLFALMERLRAEINRRTYLGLFDLECHFAIYPRGAVYRRHLDRFHDRSHRVVSWVLYLNDAWNEHDGGCLRIHKGGSGGAHFDDVPPIGGAHSDVPPIGGTLVTFLSAEVEHEVLAASRERMSVTGWFRTARPAR